MVNNNDKKSYRKFKPKGKNQFEYVRSMSEHDLVFCTGPAGSGKTSCSVGLAVDHLLSNKTKRIIVTRPTVGVDEEVDEGLGFLPGDILAKMDHWVTPIFDELRTYFNRDVLDIYIRDKTIEIAPLFYMRGRTFHNSFVVLDEAQNATYKQIKMITTRMGSNTKLVVNGDVTQSDLRFKENPLDIWLKHIIPYINGAAAVKLEKMDIVRHRLVSAILTSCENYEQGKSK